MQDQAEFSEKFTDRDQKILESVAETTSIRLQLAEANGLTDSLHQQMNEQLKAAQENLHATQSKLDMLLKQQEEGEAASVGAAAQVQRALRQRDEQVSELHEQLTSAEANTASCGLHLDAAKQVSFHS